MINLRITKVSSINYKGKPFFFTDQPLEKNQLQKISSKTNSTLFKNKQTRNDCSWSFLSRPLSSHNNYTSSTNLPTTNTQGEIEVNNHRKDTNENKNNLSLNTKKELKTECNSKK